MIFLLCNTHSLFLDLTLHIKYYVVIQILLSYFKYQLIWISTNMQEIKLGSIMLSKDINISRICMAFHAEREESNNNIWITFKQFDTTRYSTNSAIKEFRNGQHPKTALFYSQLSFLVMPKIYDHDGSNICDFTNKWVWLLTKKFVRNKW